MQFVHCKDADSPVNDDHVPPTQFEQTKTDVAAEIVEYVPA